jgi:hypothetical protein
MQVHARARLTPKGRAFVVGRVLEQDGRIDRHLTQAHGYLSAFFGAEVGEQRNVFESSWLHAAPRRGGILACLQRPGVNVV